MFFEVYSYDLLHKNLNFCNFFPSARYLMTAALNICRIFRQTEDGKQFTMLPFVKKRCISREPVHYLFKC